jgi:hypothetical protein
MKKKINNPYNFNGGDESAVHFAIISDAGNVFPTIFCRDVLQSLFLSIKQGLGYGTAHCEYSLFIKKYDTVDVSSGISMLVNTRFEYRDNIRNVLSVLNQIEAYFSTDKSTISTPDFERLQLFHFSSLWTRDGVSFSMLTLLLRIIIPATKVFKRYAQRPSYEGMVHELTREVYPTLQEYPLSFSFRLVILILSDTSILATDEEHMGLVSRREKYEFAEKHGIVTLLYNMSNSDPGGLALLVENADKIDFKLREIEQV